MTRLAMFNRNAVVEAGRQAHALKRLVSARKQLGDTRAFLQELSASLKLECVAEMSNTQEVFITDDKFYIEVFWGGDEVDKWPPSSPPSPHIASLHTIPPPVFLCADPL